MKTLRVVRKHGFSVGLDSITSALRDVNILIDYFNRPRATGGFGLLVVLTFIDLNTFVDVVGILEESISSTVLVKAHWGNVQVIVAYKQ